MINSTFNCSQVAAFNSNVVFFNAQGAIGVAVAGKVTNVDLKMVDDNFLTGGHLRVSGATFGDFCHLQVIDLDNVLGYGSGAVIRQFVTNWYMSDADPKQADFDLTYPAKVIAGLYLRLVYNSIAAVGVAPVKVAMNYDLHKVML